MGGGARAFPLTVGEGMRWGSREKGIRHSHLPWGGGRLGSGEKGLGPSRLQWWGGGS